MKGDFDEAVKNNEITAYLNGEGDYFAPEEGNMGYHNHMINFMGMLGYLKRQEHPYQLLVKYFRLYLSSLKEDPLDGWNLFKNIGCYYTLRQDNSYFLTQDEDLMDELTAEEKKKIGVLCRYVRDNFDKVPGAAQMYPIDKQFEFTLKKGCPYDLFSF